MPLVNAGRHTHYNGVFSGLGAAAAAVLAVAVFAGVLVLAVWRHIAGQATVAVQVILWTGVAAFVTVVLYGVCVLVLRLRLHVRQPETLTRQVMIQAVPVADERPVIQAPAPVAELPSAAANTHLPGVADATAPAVRAIRGDPEVSR